MPKYRRKSKKTMALVAKAARRRERELRRLEKDVRQETTWGTSAVLFRNFKDGIPYRSAQIEGERADD